MSSLSDLPMATGRDATIEAADGFAQVLPKDKQEVRPPTHTHMRHHHEGQTPNSLPWKHRGTRNR